MVTLVYLIKLPNGWLRHIPRMVVDWLVVSSTFHWLWPKSCVGLPWFAMVCLKFDKLALKMTGSCRYSSCQQLPSEFGIIKQPDFLSCDSHDTLDSWNHACIMVASCRSWYIMQLLCGLFSSPGLLHLNTACPSFGGLEPRWRISELQPVQSSSYWIVTILSSGQPEVSPLSSNICQQD